MIIISAFPHLSDFELVDRVISMGWERETCWQYPRTLMLTHTDGP